MMNALSHDVRFAFRTLARKPGFTALIILTLALGIGANAAIFSVLNAVVLRPLPFTEPDRLVTIWESSEELGMERVVASYPNFEDWRRQNGVFEGIAAISGQGFTLTDVDQPERIRGARVSAEFFPLLRVEAALGRTFLPEDDEVGAQEVALLGNGLWQRQFGADPDVIGRAITLNGAEHLVVGVLPPDFDFPMKVSGAEVWTPVSLEAPNFLTSRGGHSFRTLARMKPGVTNEQASAEMKTITRRLQQQYPETNAGWGVRVVPLHEVVVGEVRPLLLMLLAAVGLVLLIACANVASMLLARSEDRIRELAVRGALGAGRWRLVRQLLIESALLGLAGGALGLLLAAWGIGALTGLMPPGLPRSDDVGADWRVVFFALALALCAGLMFGLFPALHASPSNLPGALKEGRRATFAGRPRRRLRGAIVVGEIALAMVLLVGAGLLMRSFHRVTSIDLGFDPGNMLTFRLSLPETMGLSGDERAALYEEVLERIEALPGVRSACANVALPLTDWGIGPSFTIAGRPEPAAPEDMMALYGSIDQDYFRTMGIPLLAGRNFTDQDTRGRSGVMIINDAMARRFWPNEDPLGQQLKVGVGFDEDEPGSFEIVGIVADSRDAVLDPPEPHMYVPLRQQTWESSFFGLRTIGEPAGLIGAIRGEVAAITRQAAPTGFRTLEQYIGQSVGQRRFATILLGLYAALAVVLAAVGIYGVLSYSVAQRTHEIGVRMAIGAQRVDVLVSVLRRGCILIAAGLCVGLLLSVASTRVLASNLYEISATDPLTITGVCLLLATVALLACYIPARRATKVDPMVALRYE